MSPLKPFISLLAATRSAALKLHHFSPDDIHQLISKQIMGGINGVHPTELSSGIRKLQNASSSCPGTPYLWKIIENESGEHVGFGIGTMHLPAELVLTDDAYGSIINAVEDSCDVYGEINLRDPAVVLELEQCMTPLSQGAATVADIPDEEIKSAYEAKLLEIATMVAATYPQGDENLVDTFYQALLPLPLFLAQQFITFSNTPEYEPYLVQTLIGMPVEAFDESLLSLGRVAGGVEEVSTQCAILEDLYLSPEDLDSQALIMGLNMSLTEQINLYKCGDLEGFNAAQEAAVEAEFGNDPELKQSLLDDRNEQMAAAMADILKTADEKTMFAFGFLHWMYGEKSLDILLEDYGYSLEHLPTYGPDDNENLSNEICGVNWSMESGTFESTEASVSTDATNSPEGSASNSSKSPAATPVPDETPNAADPESENGSEVPDNSSTLCSPTILSISFMLFGLITF